MVTKVALMAAVPGLIQKLRFVDRREFEEQMSEAYADALVPSVENHTQEAEHTNPIRFLTSIRPGRDRGGPGRLRHRQNSGMVTILHYLTYGGGYS